MASRLQAAALLLTLSVAGGCAQPYAGPKTLATVGAALIAGGGATWIVGERAGRGTLVVPGAVTTAIGAGLVLGAGAWLAASVSCEADLHCPDGEECRELPAAPGGVPYKQCMRR